ncbi:DUF3472 domain-containing protein [Brucella sp. 21LCYQ03]|nr:DUF3472 domain-containing protein [Brucella sp. 21LCYQ03]
MKVINLSLVPILFMSNYAYADFPEPQYAVHITNFTRSVKDISVGGFKNLNFPIAVLSGPTEENFYYSQYTTFEHPTKDDEGFYYGIQPHSNGKARVLFSYFGKKGRVTDKAHCSAGADGGSGVSCNTVNIPFSIGTIYNFNAVLTNETEQENFWEGYVTDTITNVRTKIGSWATPKSIGYLSGLGAGFIEDYIGIGNCSDIPSTTAYFGAGTSVVTPTTTNRLDIDPAYKVGVCADHVKFTSFLNEYGGLTIMQKAGDNFDGNSNTENSKKR